MRTLLSLASLSAISSAARAHVADVSAIKHAAEHAWLGLLLLPVAGWLAWRWLARR